jgi:hypothetical protein
MRLFLKGVLKPKFYITVMNKLVEKHDWSEEIYHHLNLVWSIRRMYRMSED